LRERWADRDGDHCAKRQDFCSHPSHRLALRVL
jgi:hypothetical protein